MVINLNKHCILVVTSLKVAFLIWIYVGLENTKKDEKLVENPNVYRMSPWSFFLLSFFIYGITTWFNPFFSFLSRFFPVPQLVGSSICSFFLHSSFAAIPIILRSSFMLIKDLIINCYIKKTKINKKCSLITIKKRNDRYCSVQFI